MTTRANLCCARMLGALGLAALGALPDDPSAGTALHVAGARIVDALLRS